MRAITRILCQILTRRLQVSAFSPPPPPYNHLGIQKQLHANAQKPRVAALLRRERAPAAAVSRMHSCQHRGQQPLEQPAEHAGTQRRGRSIHAQDSGGKEPRTRRLALRGSAGIQHHKKLEENLGKMRFRALWRPAERCTFHRIARKPT